MKRALSLLCSLAIAFSLIGCAPVTVPVFEYNCLGKNGTCPTKQSNPLDFFCDVCDPDRDNIEGIKKNTDSGEDTPASESPSDTTQPSEDVSSPAADSGDVNTTHSSSGTQQKPSTSASDNYSETQEEEPAPPPTAREEKALKSAKSHLSSVPYSRSGLIKQLKAEGFSASEATYAAENCGVDWYQQAEKAAKKYLALASFTLNLLVKQLELDGYTSDQAEHGAAAAYNKIPSAKLPEHYLEYIVG